MNVGGVNESIFGCPLILDTAAITDGDKSFLLKNNCRWNHDVE